MTNEHVISESIGGDASTLIRVCKPCNDRIGHTIDLLLVRHSLLRMIGVFHADGTNATRYERHSSKAVLKDGRVLDGHFLTKRESRTTFRPDFDPLQEQADGSMWIRSEACPDPKTLPPGKNILKSEDIDMASFSFADPAAAGLEPAMIKIALGVLYKVSGPTTLQQPAFDLFRRCLNGKLDLGFMGRWPQPGNEYPPAPLRSGTNLVWAECRDGKSLVGGVSLYGKVTFEYEVPNFGLPLPGRLVENRRFNW